MITTAKGTTIGISNNVSPTTYANVSEVRSITGPTVKPKVVDITTHDSPLNFMRKIAVLIDPGDVSFEFNFDPADATQAFTTGMWNEMLGLILGGYRMVFPNAVGHLDFAGYVGQHEFMAPVDNVLAVKMQYALTGPVYAGTP